MDLSRDCSSTVPDCSEDTFATFREEKGESCRQYENESFESYYSREESEWPFGSDSSEDTQQPSSQNDEEQEPDFLDPTVAKKALIQKWINRLKDDKSSTQLAECANKLGNALITMTETPEEEWEAVRSFCAIKTDHLNHPPSSALSNRRRRSNQKQRFPLEEVFVHEVNHIVPDQLVNRLRLKNLQKSMEQLAETEMHQPSQCPGCEKKRAQLAEDAFLRRKRTVLEGGLLQEKLKDNLYTQDAVLIIGKMHQSLPKLSDDPRDIWRKLNERAPQAEGTALSEPSPKQKKHIKSRAPALSNGEYHPFDTDKLACDQMSLSIGSGPRIQLWLPPQCGQSKAPVP